tara:strand:+ start:704 stop:1819 length:1116 start_codon:yes stop_codon:yes gene_type:complete
VSVTQAIFMLAFPALLMWGQQRITVIKTIGPVIICYAVGMIAGLFFIDFIDIKTSETLTEASVPLAIPLMLFCLDLKAWLRLAPKTLLSFVFSLLSISLCAIVCSLFFKDLPELWKMAGMLVGVYTGGTPNMSAIGLSLDVSKETFIILNTSDILLSSVYLFFILGVGKRVICKFLPEFIKSNEVVSESVLETQNNIIDMIKAFGLALAIVGLSAGTSILLFGKLELPIVLLGLTGLGMLASLSSRIRNLRGSFCLGEYFLYVFCLAIGSMTDVKKLLGVDPNILLFCTVVFISAVLIHFALNKLAKIDGDTAVITNVSAIYGPAFVAPVAKSLGNPEIIISGLTCGLVGYGVGNYLGLAVAYSVKFLMGL